MSLIVEHYTHSALLINKNDKLAVYSKIKLKILMQSSVGIVFVRTVTLKSVINQ